MWGTKLIFHKISSWDLQYCKIQKFNVLQLFWCDIWRNDTKLIKALNITYYNTHFPMQNIFSLPFILCIMFIHSTIRALHRRTKVRLGEKSGDCIFTKKPIKSTKTHFFRIFSIFAVNSEYLLHSLWNNKEIFVYLARLLNICISLHDKIAFNWSWNCTCDNYKI